MADGEAVAEGLEEARGGMGGHRETAAGAAGLIVRASDPVRSSCPVRTRSVNPIQGRTNITMGYRNGNLDEIM